MSFTGKKNPYRAEMFDRELITNYKLQNPNHKSMEQLVINQGGKIVTTSRLIAEKFGKLHKHVLEAIRNIDCPADFNGTNFRPVEYLDGKGEKRPEYIITRDGFTFLVMGFTGKEAAKFKIEFIEAFNQMEKQLQNPIENLSRLDIAKMLLESEEEKLRMSKENRLLESENAVLKPKALFAENVQMSDNCILIRELSKILQNKGVKIGEKRLFQWLRDNGLLISRGVDYNSPTQKAMELKLFQIKVTTITTSDGTRTCRTPKVTGKGTVYIVNKFMQGYNNQLITEP